LQAGRRPCCRYGYFGDPLAFRPEVRLCAGQFELRQGDTGFAPVPRQSWNAASAAYWDGDCLVVPAKTMTPTDREGWDQWMWIDLSGAPVDWSQPMVLRYWNGAWFEQRL